MSAQSVAGTFDLDDNGVMQQSVLQGGCYYRVAEHVTPFGEASV